MPIQTFRPERFRTYEMLMKEKYILCVIVYLFFLSPAIPYVRNRLANCERKGDSKVDFHLPKP